MGRYQLQKKKGRIFHFQIIFVIPKYSLDPNFYGIKCFRSKILWNTKIFLDQKCFSDQKFVLDQQFFSDQKILGPNIFSKQTFFLDQNLFWLKFSGSNIFGLNSFCWIFWPNNFLDQKFFSGSKFVFNQVIFFLELSIFVLGSVQVLYKQVFPNSK